MLAIRIAISKLIPNQADYLINDGSERASLTTDINKRTTLVIAYKDGVEKFRREYATTSHSDALTQCGVRKIEYRV